MRTRVKPLSIERARRLRREATEVEKTLWWRLREFRPDGYHFRRQVPFRGYILDFVEHNRRVIIELDGGQHGLPENECYDAARDAVLKAEGYIVLRFWNGEIVENIEGVVEGILRVLKNRPPTRSASFAAAHDRSDLPTRGR